MHASYRWGKYWRGGDREAKGREGSGSHTPRTWSWAGRRRPPAGQEAARYPAPSTAAGAPPAAPRAWSWHSAAGQGSIAWQATERAPCIQAASVHWRAQEEGRQQGLHMHAAPGLDSAAQHSTAQCSSPHLQKLRLAHALRAVPRHHVRALVGQHRRQLILVLHQAQEACSVGSRALGFWKAYVRSHVAQARPAQGGGAGEFFSIAGGHGKRCHAMQLLASLHAGGAQALACKPGRSAGAPLLQAVRGRGPHLCTPQPCRPARKMRSARPTCGAQGDGRSTGASSCKVARQQWACRARQHWSRQTEVWQLG